MAQVIAVAGKGGVGKTTLCGLLIQYLCEKGKTPVLAVDADANSNLNEVLGVEAAPTLGEIREEIAKAGLDKGLGQYFAALTNMRSVGVMGDFRTYDYAIALRAVNTSDFMTADAAQLPWEVLGKVTNRIVNEVKGVNRVMYDCTGKPPATIEFE